MGDVIPQTPGTLIAWFWWAHIAWSKRSQLNNRATVLLNLLLVFLVLIYMFPLRLMFGELFSAITGGWLPSPFAARLDTGGLVTLLAIFALFCLAVLVLAGVTNSVMLFLTTSFYFLAFFNGLVQARARKAAGRVFDADSAADPPITGATETAEEE